MVISTHLPPPVMMERTAERDAVTHILCWSWAMCFSAAASSEKFQGSMNLASNTAEVASTRPSSVAAIQRCPQPQQGCLVLPHDDPGIRAADERSAMNAQLVCHSFF